MKKLLFLLPEYPSTAGIESVTATVAPELTSAGWSCDYLAPFEGRNNDAHRKPTGTEVFYFPDRSRYDTPRNRKFTLRLLTENRYDCIIFQDSYAPMERVIVEAALASRTPLIVFEHNTPAFVKSKRTLEPLYTKLGFLRRVCHPLLIHRERERRRYLFSNCAKYVLLSSAFRQDFSKASGIKDSEGKLTAIPNPLTLPAMQIPFSGKENRMIFVGRLVKEKNPALILEIWHRLSRELPDWSFSIVGDGPERSRLESMARKRDIPRLKFEGYRNPEAFYDKAKMIFLASRFEGWGLTLTEAMGRGCVPAALNSYSSLGDILTDEVDGLVMESSDPEDWAKRIIPVINEEKKLEEMSGKAFIKACGFNIENIMPMWHNLLKSI